MVRWANIRIIMLKYIWNRSLYDTIVPDYGMIRAVSTLGGL